MKNTQKNEDENMFESDISVLDSHFSESSLAAGL